MSNIFDDIKIRDLIMAIITGFIVGRILLLVKNNKYNPNNSNNESNSSYNYIPVGRICVYLLLILQIEVTIFLHLISQ